MEIHVPNAKAMRISRKEQRAVTLYIYADFKYLGNAMSYNGNCEKKVRSRIALGKAVFNNEKKVTIRLT